MSTSSIVSIFDIESNSILSGFKLNSWIPFSDPGMPAKDKSLSNPVDL